MEIITNFMEIITTRYEEKEEEINAKTRRDFIIKKAVKEINKLREGTKFKKETAANLSLRINNNPYLCGEGNDLEYILSECSLKGNYKYLYYILK